MRLPGWAIFLIPLFRLLPLLLLIGVVFAAWRYTVHVRAERLEAAVAEAPRSHWTMEEAAVERAAAIAAPRPPLSDLQVAQLARVGKLVAAPPLRPRPETLRRLESPIDISGFIVADAAGVAVVHDVSDRYALLDVGTGEVIAQGSGPSPEAISPNGRVVALAVVGGGTELRDAVSGDLLMPLWGVAPYQVRWIGDVGLMHMVQDASVLGGDRLVFRDFATGLESSLYTPLGGGENPGVVPIPGKPGHYALLQDKHWSEMVLTHGDAGWVATILGERTWSGWHSRDAINLSADGRFHVSIAPESQLVVVDIAAGAERVEDFGTFRLQESLFTADPDRVLLRGFFQLAPGQVESAAFLYSLSTGLLAEVPREALPTPLSFIRALAINATVDDAILPVTLPAGETPAEIGLVLALADPRMQAPGAERLPVAPGEAPPEASPLAATAAVADLVQGARLVGVGVYEAKPEPPPPRSEREEELESERMRRAIEDHDYETIRAIQRARRPAADAVASVRVRVLRTKQPTVLVLSSYETVRWVVSIDPGADVRGILVSGHGQASVIGTTLPVHRIGQAYAYRDSERERLDAEVRQWTGRVVDEFHGEYAGESFVLME